MIGDRLPDPMCDDMWEIPTQKAAWADLFQYLNLENYVKCAKTPFKRENIWNY